MSQASDLFRQNDDEGLLKSLRVSGISGELARVEELTVKFSEHQEQLEEVCAFLIFCWFQVVLLWIFLERVLK